MFCTSEMVDQKLLQMRTGYFAKVLAVNGNRINVQPLYSAQAINGEAGNAAVVTNVLVAASARHKIGTETRQCAGSCNPQNVNLNVTGNCTVTVSELNQATTGNINATASGTVPGCVNFESRTHLTLIPIAVGDLVYCVVADRDITNNSNGSSGTPTTRHHDISDSVCIALF